MRMEIVLTRAVCKPNRIEGRGQVRYALSDYLPWFNRLVTIIFLALRQEVRAGMIINRKRQALTHPKGNSGLTIYRSSLSRPYSRPG